MKTTNAQKRARIHAKYGGCCAYCGREITIKSMQVDHIQAKLCGGTDHESNLNPACFACNNFKMTHSIEQFRHEISRQIERGRQRSVNFRTAERFGLIEIKQAEVVFHFERATLNVSV